MGTHMPGQNSAEALLETFEPRDRLKLLADRALFPLMPWLAGAMLGMMVWMFVKVSVLVVPMAPVVGYHKVAPVFGVMLQQFAYVFGPIVVIVLLARWRPFVEWQIRRRRTRRPRKVRDVRATQRSISYMLWGWVLLTLLMPVAIIAASAPLSGYFNADAGLLIASMVAWAMIIGGLFQRRGRELVCVLCDYPWRADDPVVCPECGLERVPPYGLRLGVRDRKWWLVGVGVVLMTLTVVARVVTMR